MSGHRLHLTDAQKRLLRAWVRAGKTPQRVTRRARIVLLAAEGRSIRAVASAVGVSRGTVILWHRRFREHGPEALWRDAPGRGRKPSIPPDTVARIRALIAAPPPNVRRWSVRSLADASGVSRASVHRILRTLQVDPQRRSSVTKRRRQIVWREATVLSEMPL
jgi:transposase